MLLLLPPFSRGCFLGDFFGLLLTLVDAVLGGGGAADDDGAAVFSRGSEASFALATPLSLVFFMMPATERPPSVESCLYTTRSFAQ